MSPASEKYVVDEPVPNLVRVRYGQHLHDDSLIQALECARTVVEQAGFVGAVVSGSGRYPNEADLLVFPKRRTDGVPAGPKWDKAAGQAADDDKHLPVSMVMIREDVWQALIAYPHKSSVNLLCTTCGQESYYHEQGRVCPLKQMHASPYSEHEEGTTYTHGPVFPDGIEHKIVQNDYGELVWYGISAYRAGVKHAWAAISAHFAARAKRLDQDSSYFGNFILRHGIVEDAENLTGVTWIMLESTPGVIGISEHLSMLLADKTEPPIQLLDAIAELAAVCHVLRGVGVKLRPAGFGPQYAEWPEFVRYHRTLAHIASAKADAREQNDPCFSSLQAALLTLAYDPNDGI
jgi:hypothetical protein